MRVSVDPPACDKGICPHHHRYRMAYHDSSACPADVALACFSDIVQAIRDLYEGPSLEEKFSLVLAGQLNKLFPGLVPEITCFWALQDKPSKEEGKRVADTGAVDLPASRKVINKLVSEINPKYSSVAFLEKVAKSGHGSAHIFDLIPTVDGIKFTTYDRPTMAGTPVEVFCKYVIKENFSYILRSTGKLDFLDEEMSEERRRESIIAYTDSFSTSGEDLFERLSALPENELHGSIIKKDEAVEACRHFGLIDLLRRNSGFGQASYILAPTFRGEVHSSMVVFWPKMGSSRDVDIRLKFLMHIVLGMNAINAQKVEEQKRWAKIIALSIEHDTQNLIRETEAMTTLTKDDWSRNPQMSNEEKYLYFEEILARVRLGLFAKSFGMAYVIGQDHGGRHMVVTVANLYEDLFKATRAREKVVVFQPESLWKECALPITNLILVVLANLVTNARKFTLPAESIIISLEVVDSRLTIKVKNKRPIQDGNRKTIADHLQRPNSGEIPVSHRGHWICKAIMDRYGGKIYLGEPESTYKTIFVVDLPLGLKGVRG